MRLVPIAKNTKEYVLFVILDDAGINRIKAYDPAQVDMPRLGPPWTGMKLHEIQIMFVTPEEENEFDNVKSGAEAIAMLKKLSRGWEFRPDRGDSDAPYMGKHVGRN